jgi:hypothetical protein
VVPSLAAYLNAIAGETKPAADGETKDAGADIRLTDEAAA